MFSFTLPTALILKKSFLLQLPTQKYYFNRDKFYLSEIRLQKISTGFQCLHNRGTIRTYTRYKWKNRDRSFFTPQLCLVRMSLITRCIFKMNTSAFSGDGVPHSRSRRQKKNIKRAEDHQPHLLS